jgi:pyruvate kinase
MFKRKLFESVILPESQVVASLASPITLLTTPSTFGSLRCKLIDLTIRFRFVVSKVIITNQVLHSMITNPRPTRAECTDVVNAILDGVDCFCLTNTTAEGAYPIKTVKMLLKQCKETERTIPYRDVYTAVRQHMVYMNPNLISITESMASSAVKTAWDLDATLLMALSEEPDTVRFVAKYRSKRCNNPLHLQKEMIFFDCF